MLVVFKKVHGRDYGLGASLLLLPTSPVSYPWFHLLLIKEFFKKRKSIHIRYILFFADNIKGKKDLLDGSVTGKNGNVSSRSSYRKGLTVPTTNR